jgi:hypothetical protein
MISRRSAVFTAITAVFLIAIWHNSDLIHRTGSGSSALSLPGAAKSHEETITQMESPKPGTTAGGNTISLHTLKYFNQAFSADKPAQYDFLALRQQCERTKWLEDEAYLHCKGMGAGLTSVVSQVKVCLKMAIEAGTGIVLPSIPLRDPQNLLEYNFLNDDALLNYDQWFDAAHLIEQIGRVCPQMQIIRPDQLDSPFVPVKNRWILNIATAPGYQPLTSYFWAGRPFKAFFDEQYTTLKNLDALDPVRDDSKKGITTVSIAAPFLLFRITDDPTGQDLRLWNDLSHLIRFGETPRHIVNQLLSHMNRPFYGVHFRVESDTIWSSLENQLNVDLDALDKAWEMYGKPGTEKPLVYLACGDREQVEKFVSAGKERGWEVTHKWQLAQWNADLLQNINDLAFDFQGAVDMGIMIKSEFFLGITGSAFSSTIANMRDVTGRYRGSSFTVFDDENARNHLFNDLDAVSYACCL